MKTTVNNVKFQAMRANLVDGARGQKIWPLGSALRPQEEQTHFQRQEGRVDPFTKKDWYDVKAPSVFSVRNVGKTLVSRTQGTKIAMLQLGFDADRIALIAEVDVLKERLHNIIGTKEEMEEAKVHLNAKFSDLQVEKDTILLKLAEEEKLKSLFVEEIERLKLEFGYLQKENEKLQFEINSQKRLLEEENDGLRETIRKIKAAKGEIDGLWAMQELKVVDQQKQISMLFV